MTMSRKPSLKNIRPGAIPFWMLNDASTPDEKIAYLRACHAGGFEAVALHPRSGNLIPYASREWFDMIAAIVAEGRRLNMDIWLYDEDPYPSGAAGGLVMARRPDLKARSMAWQTCPSDCKTGSLWCISENPVLWAGLISDRAPRMVHDLTDHVGPVRHEWFMSEWDSRHYYEETPLVSCPRGNAVQQWFAMRVPEIPPGYTLAAVTLATVGAEGPWGSLPDLLNPDSFEQFKTLSLDPYHARVGEHYGKTIPGIFTDEAKPNGNWPVTPGMWAEFESQYGYDLRSRVFRLFGDPIDDADSQTRLDYRRWIARRFLDAFVHPYRRYCDRVGLRLVGHFSPEDDPLAEALSVMSVMPIMQAMSGPGTDIIMPQVGNDQAPTLNLGSLRAASIKARYGTDYCISESLALSDWTATTQLSRGILAWQKVLGIDRFFLHGFYTSSEGIQNYEAPPDYGPNSSIFAGMGVLNDWLKRLESRLEGATETAPVAILNSLPSFWTAGGTRTDRLLQMRSALWQIVRNALGAQAGIHLIDETEFADVILERDAFTIGARTYRMLLVPDIDILGQCSLDVMKQLVKRDVPVIHFGGGARNVLPECGRLRAVKSLPGEILRQAWPSLSWCRKRLPCQTRVTGTGARHLFVRRFHDQRGELGMLAVNVDDAAHTVNMAPIETEGLWQPVEADGLLEVRRDGTRWTVPPRGFGVFAMADRKKTASPVKRRVNMRPLSRNGLTFQRLDPNTARLCAATVIRPDTRSARVVPYPMPFWRCFEDYQARRTTATFSGFLPLQSRPLIDSLKYRFEFALDSALRVPVSLILDPRCARGCCAITLNGQTLRRAQRFPLDGIQPLRIPVRHALKTGDNQLELTFALDSALDGLLSQLYLEGDFDVALRKGTSPDAAEFTPVLSPASRGGSGKEDEDTGWERSGMPHYMGRGLYCWTETIPQEACSPDAQWTLELDGVVDSAECRINGQSAGFRAWQPWHWRLPALIPGGNRFELLVSGTAGNRHSLHWPNQPQGWIGSGRLSRQARDSS